MRCTTCGKETKGDWRWCRVCLLDVFDAGPKEIPRIPAHTNMKPYPTDHAAWRERTRVEVAFPMSKPVLLQVAD